MEEQLKQIKAYSLSDKDIQTLLEPDTSIITYPQFADYNDILDCFDSEGRCVFLFLTQSASSGHWLCMFLRKGHIEYFDSYGQAPEAQRRWLTKEQLEELGQGERYLYNLLSKSGIPVYYNKVEYQKDKQDINTCGRWVAARLNNKNMSNAEFNNFVKDSMKEYGVKTPDDWVALYTYSFLGK
jgi:hypothetical protein